MYTHDNISLNSSQNEKNILDKICRETQITILCSTNPPLPPTPPHPKIVLFMR